MTGLQREIRSKILGATAHISIFRSGNEPFDNYREVVKMARAVPACWARRRPSTARGS